MQKIHKSHSDAVRNRQLQAIAAKLQGSAAKVQHAHAALEVPARLHVTRRCGGDGPPAQASLCGVERREPPFDDGVDDASDVKAAAEKVLGRRRHSRMPIA